MDFHFGFTIYIIMSPLHTAGMMPCVVVVGVGECLCAVWC